MSWLLAPFQITQRDLRLLSGIVLLIYIATHLANHALGLISLHVAEVALSVAVIFWHSVPATIVLYGAVAVHIALAILAIYQRRTFKLPPIELLRIALGLWLPLMLIGHAVTTRLEFELLSSPATYTRVIAKLWASDGEWQHLGLLAPGWLHGCLGLRFAFGQRPFWHRHQLVLFGFALLLPVLSALGFLEMGRDIARASLADGISPVVGTPVSASGVAVALAWWRYGLILGYVGIIGFALGARSLRNLVERRRRGLVTLSYPDRKVHVPRGWSVLEASRAFHIPHASSCGGRARCSTCRIQVGAGAELCPPPNHDERATLASIRASPEIRLACQLRPDGDISVVPLVRAVRPIYRQANPQVDADRDIVLLLCSFTNRAELEREHLAHDVLFAFTRYAESVGAAVHNADGIISYIGHDSICALFGLHNGLAQASRQGLAATKDIDRALQTINAGLDRRWGCKANVVVSLHAGNAALSHIGHQIGTIIPGGAALEVAQELSDAALRRGRSFGVSRAVFDAAEITPSADDSVLIPLRGQEPALLAYLTDNAPGNLTNSAEDKRQWRKTFDHASEVIKTIIQS